MTTRPEGSSRYSVFDGSSARQSAAVDAASTCAPVRVLPGTSFAGVAPCSAALSSGSARARPTHMGLTLSSRQPREAIRAPVFAPNTVVYEEQTVRVVLCLDGPQALVVLAPESAAPLRIEIVAL